MSDMTNQKPKKNHICFLPALAVFAFACFVRYFRSYMSTYYTTLFALNYDYGFIPQGFLGTFYQYLSERLPWEMQNYIAVYNFSGFFTVIYFLILFLFYGVCCHLCRQENKRNLQHLIVFLSIFAFPMFMSSTNFGSVYLYFCIIMLLCVILILIEKMEWLIVPLGMIGVCIHEDFIFTNTSLIVILLLYKLCFTEKKIKKFKYITILVTFLACLTYLYIYFTQYSQYIGDMEVIVPEIKEAAKLLSKSGLTYNPFIIKHDIMGMDRAPMDAVYHNYNVQDFPVFCVLFAPYLYYGLCFFLQLIKDKEIAPQKRFLYLAALLGGVSMVPLFITKTEYGVYMFNLFFYYISILIVGLTMHDEHINCNFNSIKTSLKNITPLHFVWFLYPFILTPFKGVTISTQIHDLAEIIFTEMTFFLPIQ